MRILICTPLYPPDIGGPATYAENLSEAFIKLGNEVKLAVVGKEKNIFSRYFNYFFSVYKQAGWTDVVYALDLVSAGFPAMLAGRLKGKPVVFRTGGDFLWEKAYQKGWTESSISEYYKKDKNFSEKILFYFSHRILKGMNLVIFSTVLQSEIYQKYYGVTAGKVRLVANAVSGVEIKKGANIQKNIVFAGRLIKLKNLERLIRAFAGLKDPELKLLIFGEGPEKENLIKEAENSGAGKRVIFRGSVDKKTLADEIAVSLFVILPSVTDLSPNLVLECISVAKPVIVTKNTGLSEKMTDAIITIDPFSEKDIKEKMEYFLNPGHLAGCAERMKRLSLSERNWRQVALEHLNIFKQVIK